MPQCNQFTPFFKQLHSSPPFPSLFPIYPSSYPHLFPFTSTPLLPLPSPDSLSTPMLALGNRRRVTKRRPAPTTTINPHPSLVYQPAPPSPDSTPPSGQRQRTSPQSADSAALAPPASHIIVSSDSDVDLPSDSRATTSTPTTGSSSTESESPSLANTTEHIYSSPLPILVSESPMVSRGEYIAPTSSALANMTFQEWFDDYCANPANSASLSHLYTERQYFLLLRLVTTDIRIAEMNCRIEGEKRWLYHKHANNTFRSVVMSHGSQPRQLGQVLMWQPGRPSLNSTAPVSLEALRRVIPLSQIVACINYCHAESTGHRGQDATLQRIQQQFEGVSRVLVREAVKRCPICQSKAAKQFKAKLQPIVANQLFERLLIDLIDKRRQSDRGFHYIMHVADHHSRCHYIRPLRTKEASAVAAELAWIFADIGGCSILQSDQGPEFKGEVSALCDVWGVQQVRSSPYTPSTNGLVEKWNHVVKVGITAWQAENHTNAWVACLPILQYQMNTTWSRSIRCTPFELVYGHINRHHARPVMPTQQLNFLEDQEWVEDPEQPDAPLQPPSSLDLFRVPPSPSPSPPPPPSPPPSRPPLPTSSNPSASTSGLVPDEAVKDCAFGVAGELGRLCSALLNVAGLHFRRWGCIGNGRCAICGVEIALLNCVWTESRAHMEVYCDERRQEYRGVLETVKEEERKEWLQQMVDVGGGDSAVGSQSPAQARNSVRRSLLRDLGDFSCNLGWEFLVLAAAYRRVNILVFPVVITGQAMEAVEPRLIPPRWNDSNPVIVIYHRAFYLPDAEVDGGVDMGGHYEAIFCDDDVTGRKQSLFYPGDPAWTHLRRLGTDVSATAASNTARAQMENYYNLNVAVRDFAVGDAVGVRTNYTKKRTRKRGVVNIPGLVVVVRDNVRVGGATVGQRVYTCLTKYGVIDRQIKVDGLTYLSSNNHPVLFEQLRQHLSDDTWRLEGRVTMENAVEAFIAERESATGVVPSRRQHSRSATGVEDLVDEGNDDNENDNDEEGAEDVEGQAGQSQATVSVLQAQQYPIRIVRRSGARYQVEWNDPPGEKTWESVNVWDQREEYKDLVLAFRAGEGSQSA
jgi:hypothetical protein